jgi:DtxR family Mn-dependent transcriptional regulator
VRRVRDESAEMLRYLSGLGLGIDSVLEVTDVQPFNGPITLRIGEDIRSIGREAADHVFVERHEE